MDTKAIPKKLPLNTWAKILDKDEITRILEWAVGNPGVIAQPYTKNITEGEFIQLLMHVITLFSNKITFTETPINNWDDIAAFIGMSVKRSKRIAKDFGMPVASINGYPFSTKERLSVWMNNLITQYPYYKTMSSTTKRIKDDQHALVIHEVKKIKQAIINYGKYDLDLLEYFDKSLNRLETRRKKYKDSLESKTKDKMEE